MIQYAHLDEPTYSLEPSTPCRQLLAARLTILIPIVGYFIVFSAWLSQYTALIPEIGPDDQTVPSVPPRLFLLYFGLCFVAAGSAIYSIFCPNTIKQNSSAEQFAITASHAGRLPQQQMRVAIYNSQFDEAMSDFAKSEMDRVDEINPLPEAQRNIHLATFQFFYRYEDERYPLARLAAAILYVLGFIILAIPATHIFLRVLSVLYGITLKQGFGALLG